MAPTVHVSYIITCYELNVLGLNETSNCFFKAACPSCKCCHSQRRDGTSRCGGHDKDGVSVG